MGEAERGSEFVRLSARLDGRVQGVGLRWWIRCRALELRLVGSATNLADGQVEVVAEGPRAACEGLLALLAPDAPTTPPPGAPSSWYPRPGRIVRITRGWSAPHGQLTGFTER
jgi:acylphosphatase